MDVYTTVTLRHGLDVCSAAPEASTVIDTTDHATGAAPRYRRGEQRTAKGEGPIRWVPGW
jgi:hypothetical protein